MSRIGKLPIKVPENVDVNYSGSEIIVKGKFGTLETKIPDLIAITEDNNNLIVSLKNEKQSDRSLHGLYRTLINNMVVGVSEQFKLTSTFSGIAIGNLPIRDIL